MAPRLRRTLIVVAGIASLALVSLGLLDLFSPALDISSCPSDNLGEWGVATHKHTDHHLRQFGA